MFCFCVADCKEHQSSLASHLVSKEQNITPVTVLDGSTEEREKTDIMGPG